MDSLFGAEGSLIVRFVVAFVIVLALIGLTFWLIRRFGTARVGTAAQRGRQPRLAVIDAAPIDGRRRLVLVRRDNVEHLLMIGGPTDVVVEQNIVRAVPVNAPRDVPVPRQPGAEGRPEPARIQPLDEDWPQPEPVPRTYARPEPAVRARVRSSRDRSSRDRSSPERSSRARSNHVRSSRALPNRARSSNLPCARRCRRAFASPLRLRSYPAAEPAETPAPDAALASMAQRLEAALRRPGAPEPRPPARSEPAPDLVPAEPTTTDLAIAAGAETRQAQIRARQPGRGNGEPARPSAREAIARPGFRAYRPAD
jgi:flagellar biogenesis protein FliO